jgi:hypothetical protein
MFCATTDNTGGLEHVRSHDYTFSSFIQTAIGRELFCGCSDCFVHLSNIQGGSNMTWKAAAQWDLFTHKLVPVIFEPPCMFPPAPWGHGNSDISRYDKPIIEQIENET